MPKYKVTLPTPDGDSIESIWEYDMNSEAIWSLVSYAYKEEYGEYPTEASIECMEDDDDEEWSEWEREKSMREQLGDEDDA